MSFSQFQIVTKLISKETEYFLIAEEWTRKRENLLIAVLDIPTLVKEYSIRKIEPHPENANMKIVDQVPFLRLSNACESAVNCLYSLADIAASFANKATKGKIPSSFHKLCTKAETLKDFKDISVVLGDLSWYLRVREIRTELTHYSSIFIIEEDSRPKLMIKCYRRESDKRYFTEKSFIDIEELITWIKNAVRSIDNFADYLLTKYLLNNFDPSYILTIAKYDKYGFPIIKEDKRFEIEKISVKDYFNRYDIKL